MYRGFWAWHFNLHIYIYNLILRCFRPKKKSWDFETNRVISTTPFGTQFQSRSQAWSIQVYTMERELNPWICEDTFFLEILENPWGITPGFLRRGVRNMWKTNPPAVRCQIPHTFRIAFQLGHRSTGRDLVTQGGWWCCLRSKSGITHLSVFISISRSISFHTIHTIHIIHTLHTVHTIHTTWKHLPSIPSTSPTMFKIKAEKLQVCQDHIIRWKRSPVLGQI